MTSTGAPEPRIGDAEREAAVTALSEHYAAGRLTKEEFDERSDQAWAARTAAGLWPLFADLPRPSSARSSAPASAAPPAMPQLRADRWWLGPVLTPVLAVVAVLVVLTHLPLILLVALVWLMVSRGGRQWAHSRGHADWSRGRPAPWSQRR
jgi:hypothetical protein